MFSGAEAFLECRRGLVPFAIFVDSVNGPVVAVVVGGRDLCLFVGAIQASSGNGFKTDLEVCEWRILDTPTELDLAGIALGEVGFSPAISDIDRKDSTS